MSLAKVPSVRRPLQPSRTGRASINQIPITGRATTDVSILRRVRPSSEPVRTERKPLAPAPSANRGSLSANRGSLSANRGRPLPRPNPSDPRELKKKIAELEKERDAAVALAQELSSSKEALKAENALLQLQLRESRDKNAKLETELKRSEEESTTLKKTLIEEGQRVRTLLNDVVDLKGKIRVVVRLRPFLDGEEERLSHLGFPDMKSISLNSGSKPTTYQFQHVFGCGASQEYVFDELKELIESVVHGYNVAVIAYGQTGSGKTYTMRGGDREHRGIIPRAVDFIFTMKDKLKSIDWKYEYTASFLEVYNDDVFDLLKNQRTKLKVSMGAGHVDIPELTTVTLRSPQDLDGLMLLADKNRSTAATKMNETSSRSHAVFSLRVTATNAMSGQTLTSTLSLVDLAGSERAKESQVEGERFTEMTHINKALSNLQNVIRCQLQKEAHVPYRNSKLTMLLQECLGKGNSKTLMFVNLRPSFGACTETKRSLEFAMNTSRTVIGAPTTSRH